MLQVLVVVVDRAQARGGGDVQARPGMIAEGALVGKQHLDAPGGRSGNGGEFGQAARLTAPGVRQALSRGVARQ
ncbi:hypothetical protein D9M69_600530 [compost metagenome]